MAFVCIAVMFVVPARFVAAIVFCADLERALWQCHPDARRMAPGLVYLNLIPCFHYVWQLVTVVQVSNSLQTEFHDRDLDDGDTDYGRMVGLTFALLAFIDTPVMFAVSQIVPGSEPAQLVVWGVLTAAWFCMFVLYWVRIAGLGRRLEDDNELHAGLDDEAVADDD